MKGDLKIEATYNGALYHFVSQDTGKHLEKSPSKYAPAYGGFCGYAGALARCARPIRGLVHRDGQLIVQHTKGADELWQKDVPAKAEGGQVLAVAR